MAENDAKTKALQNALLQIEKQFGKGTVMKMSDKPPVNIDVISSGSIKINKALGVGGFPRGRIIEIYGPESGGKTTLALHAVAECQKKGGKAVYIDAEHALDPAYAKAIGVDVDDLYICQPSYGEQALEVADKIIQSHAVDIVVIDSVAALVPKTELEGEMGDQHVGLQARMMSQALRKITANANKANCTVIFINQIREKVGVMFGNPETTAGGRALKFYATMRLEVRRTETVKTSGEAVSNKVKIKIVKNKVAPPFKEAITTIAFGKGLDINSEILDESVENGSVIKSGSWFSLPSGERIGQGAENAKTYIAEHEDLRNKLLDKINNSEEIEEQDIVTEPEDPPRKRHNPRLDIEIDE